MAPWNIAQLRGIIFLSIFVLLYHEINATNLCRHPRRSNIQRIRIDLPNTAVGPKNRRKCMVSRGLHHVAWEHGSSDATFPGNMDQVMPCSLGTWIK